MLNSTAYSFIIGNKQIIKRSGATIPNLIQIKVCPESSKISLIKSVSSVENDLRVHP